MSSAPEPGEVQMMHRMFIAVAGVALLAPVPALGGSVNLGLISFDVLIPSDTLAPGVNVFNISNFTGDPATGGFALPPDFTSLDSLTFLSSSLTLTIGGASSVISLGDIGPGSLSPTDLLQFADGTLFDSALFSATLSQASFLLDGGATFTAASTSISAQLLPSAGASLTAGTDRTVITVDEAANLVPEPATGALLAATLALCIPAWRKISSKPRSRV